MKHVTDEDARERYLDLVEQAIRLVEAAEAIVMMTPIGEWDDGSSAVESDLVNKAITALNAASDRMTELKVYSGPKPEAIETFVEAIGRIAYIHAPVATAWAFAIIEWDAKVEPAMLDSNDWPGGWPKVRDLVNPRGDGFVLPVAGPERWYFPKQYTFEVGECGRWTAAAGQKATLVSIDDEYIHLRIDDPGQFLMDYNGGQISVPKGKGIVLQDVDGKKLSG